MYSPSNPERPSFQQACDEGERWMQLRRCADLETNLLEDLSDEDFDRLQISIDPARRSPSASMQHSPQTVRSKRFRAILQNKPNRVQLERVRFHAAPAPMQIREEIQMLLRQNEPPVLTTRTA